MTAYSQFEQVADRVFGDTSALDQVDAILVQNILTFVNSRPALGNSDTVALNAIVAVSETNPDLARSLMAELMHGM